MSAPRQRQLPLPWNLAKPERRQSFAHPAEAELGRILTYYGVRWVYEPTNFVLRWTPDGRPAESFTPDFYLPGQRLYIELTTMRQPLVTRKNRKLRRLRELFPGVSIKLLYRRDLERLFSAYDEHVEGPERGRAGEIIAREGEIRARVGELVDQMEACGLFVFEEGGPQDGGLALVSFEPSARRFRDLLRAEIARRGVAVAVDECALSRYGRQCGRKTARLVVRPTIELGQRTVLLVTDIVSTGLSAGFVLNWARRHGAGAVELCTLFDRREARLIELEPRFAAFAAPSVPIAGFGIGPDPDLAALPAVVIVETA